MDEAEALLRQIHERFPDYFFARTGMAKLHIVAGRLDEAKALLDPLMQRRRFHLSEFAAFASAEIDYWLAKGSPEGARQWYDMWKQMDPDHPILAVYRSRVFPAMEW